MTPSGFASLSEIRSGKLDDYWRVLRDAGNLTPEKMAKFQNPITATPLYLPHLLNGVITLHWVFIHFSLLNLLPF